MVPDRMQMGEERRGGLGSTHPPHSLSQGRASLQLRVPASAQHVEGLVRIWFK